MPEKLAERLKPCPFCGSEAEVITNDEEISFTGGELMYSVCCTWCSGNSGWALTQEDAITAWDRRINHD